MREDLLGKFRELFRGGNHAYGQWHPRDGAVTKHGAVPEQAYIAHLQGEVGLGLVPVSENGQCRFAAIDIDVDTINHVELLNKVAERHMPLNVCRSKSGGAHLYLLTHEPGLPATAMIQVLQRWAKVLGYPSAEIFPKQTRANAQNVGSWINLPYFGADGTTRYAVGPQGALSLEEFIVTAKFYDSNNGQQVDETEAAGIAEMPPCLATLTREGIGQGFRNQALFNFAVFYRKSQPSNWQEGVIKHNREFFSPPLESREVLGIVGSANKANYTYLCDQSPIREHCNREVCLKLKFGIANKPWDEAGSFDDFLATNCRKFLSDPPQYILEVNGKDITLTWDEMFNFKSFKSSVGQKLNIVIPVLKQNQWEMTVKDLISDSKRIDIEAPDDASAIGMVVEKFHEFLSLRERATEKEDILKGLPLEVGNDILFRGSDLKKYLQALKLDTESMSRIYLVLKNHGGRHHTIRINGKATAVWAFPKVNVNEQTEMFTAANFKNDFGEEM
jgi:hypothetical protein